MRYIFFFLLSSLIQTLKTTSSILQQITKALNCSPILEVVISLALTHSNNAELVQFAGNHLKVCLPTLIQSYVDLGNVPIPDSATHVEPKSFANGFSSYFCSIFFFVQIFHERFKKAA